MIQGSGLIEIPMQCMIQSENIELMAENRYNMENPIIINPALNISTLIDTSKEIIQQNFSSFPDHHISFELDKLRNAIDRQKENLKTEKINNHDIHHYALLYTIIVAIIAILGYIFKSKFKCMIKAKNKKNEDEIKKENNSVKIESPDSIKF